MIWAAFGSLRRPTVVAVRGYFKGTIATTPGTRRDESKAKIKPKWIRRPLAHNDLSDLWSVEAFDRLRSEGQISRHV